MAIALNVRRPTAEVVMHAHGCASVDHAVLLEKRLDSWDFQGKNPSRNNQWIKLDADVGRMKAAEIAAQAGPLLFPSKSKVRDWVVKQHTCM